jgi:hypothetical protein
MQDRPRAEHRAHQGGSRGTAPLPGDIELKHAEQRWAAYTQEPESLAGTSLLHTEWTPGNVLVSDRARLVDWAWPTRGAPWIDPACLAVWLIASGHAPRSAESWAARVPSWHDAPASALDEFARIQALMWEGIAADSTEEWTAGLARAARNWAAHRETRLPAQGHRTAPHPSKTPATARPDAPNKPPKGTKPQLRYGVKRDKKAPER